MSRLGRFFVSGVILALVYASAPAAVAAPKGVDRYALIVGVDTFVGGTRPNVGAVGDALAVRELLRLDGWRDDRIRVLTNQAATQEAIRQGMQWLVDNCSEGSYCLFHYSGHTKLINTGADGEGLHEYLWPHDNRFISDTEFSDFMRRLRGFAWVDVSACEAAGFDHGISSPRRLFTGASLETEKAFEYPAWTNSVWTGALIEKAMIEKQADFNSDGYVTLAEALPYAAEVAARHTADQIPSAQHAYISGGQAASWFPAPPPPAVPARACILLIICL